MEWAGCILNYIAGMAVYPDSQGGPLSWLQHRLHEQLAALSTPRGPPHTRMEHKYHRPSRFLPPSGHRYLTSSSSCHRAQSIFLLTTNYSSRSAIALFLCVQNSQFTFGPN